LNTVERYDPRQNKWTPVAPMSTRRKHLGCAVFNNFIYAVGGRDDCMELSSAERYNPHTNSWSPIVAMTSRRSGVSAARERDPRLSLDHPWLRSETPPDGCSVFFSYESSMCNTEIEHPRVPFTNASLVRSRCGWA